MFLAKPNTTRIYHNISVAHAGDGQKKPAIFRSGLNNGVRNLRNQCRNQQERHPLSLAGKSVGGKKPFSVSRAYKIPGVGRDQYGAYCRIRVNRFVFFCRLALPATHI